MIHILCWQVNLLCQHFQRAVANHAKHEQIECQLKTGHLKKRQIYFTTHKMVQMSNVCIINGLHMHQILILELFELHRVQISVQDFVLIDIYFFILLLWVLEFGRIFELHKMHWIKQNWLTIIQGKSKRCIIISHQAFWNVKLLFEGKFWYGYTYFFDIKH